MTSKTSHNSWLMLLRRGQTIDKVGQLLWAAPSCQRQSADEIVEPWHTSLLTSRQWRQKSRQ